ncbi:hypothetical protein EJB05_56448 [Eragrostis curvula]|uniref:Uncharacterized protein n=1 Tax=Eragrostis curvula TaxID=38414 RepID=A0A5J9SGN2_9POAL|nr:hypothetical protein EJB05_56448 [Eragrostis curvula]
MEGDRRRRGATKDERHLLPRHNLHADDEEPIFPLDKETMISMLQTLSAFSLLCISVANVTALQHLDESRSPHLAAILVSLPYAFLPFGIAGLAAATAAKTRTHLVGCASGCLLGEVMFCLIAGGVVVAQGGANAWIVGAVTLVILVATVLGWSFAFSYPKFLRCIWTSADTSQRQPCPSCRAAENSVVSPTVEGFTDLCLTCGASRQAVDTGVVATSRNIDQEARELVVTNPLTAHLITLSSVIFFIAVIAVFAYIVYLHFKIDGPLWAAVVSCAAESPLFVVPLCMVPMLRDAFISIYALGSPDSSRSDLNTRLLASENV